MYCNWQQRWRIITIYFISIHIFSSFSILFPLFCYVPLLCKTTIGIMSFFLTDLWKWMLIQISHKLHLQSLMEKTTIFVLSKWSLTWRRIMKSFRCQNELVDYVPVRGTRLLSEIYERCNVSVCEPANFEEAKKSLNWIAVMKKLLSMIEKNQTWICCCYSFW